MNYQMVNNPEYGRCEFLGYYCKYGDSQSGCKESYLQGCKRLVIQEFFSSHLPDAKEHLGLRWLVLWYTIRHIKRYIHGL